MFLKKYQSHTLILTISNGMNMSLPPPCFSVLKMYIQRLNYQVFPMKTSEAFQIWTKCVENKWEGNEYLWVKENLIVLKQRATELYFTFCVIWG